MSNVIQLGAGGNDFSASMDFTQTFTADNDGGTAAVSVVALVRGCGKGSAAGLPPGITMGGDHDNYNEMQDSFQKTGIRLTELVLDSANTAHFTGTRAITLYERPFNGRPAKQQKILLSKYKVSDGSGTNSTLTLTFATPIVVTERTVILIEVIKNSALTVTGIYDYEETLRPLARAANAA